MKLFSEQQIEKLAGVATLTESEERDCAASVSALSGVVVSCLVSNRFGHLKKAYRSELRDRAKRKAMEQWIKDNHAILDPHRKKWIIL